MSSDVGEEGRRAAGRRCASRCGAVEVDVLAALRPRRARRAGRPRRGTTAHDEQQAADDDRARPAGRPGPRGDTGAPGRRRVDEDDDPDDPEEQGDTELGAAERPLSGCSPGSGELMPGPARSGCRATRLSCSVRKVANSSPVRKASVQPFWPQRVLPRLAVVHLVDDARPAVCLSASLMPGRGHDAAPVGEHQVDARLLEGRGVDARRPLRRRWWPGRGRRRPRSGRVNSPAPEVANVDLVAEDGRQQVAAAVVRHEVDRRGVDADRLRELHRQQVVRAAGGGAAADG